MKHICDGDGHTAPCTACAGPQCTKCDGGARIVCGACMDAMVAHEAAYAQRMLGRTLDAGELRRLAKWHTGQRPKGNVYRVPLERAWVRAIASR